MTSGTRSTEVERPLARVLSGISQVLESDDDIETRVRHVLDQMRQIVPYDRCALLTSGLDERDTLIVVPSSDPNGTERLRPALMRLWDLLSKGVDPQSAAGSGSLAHLDWWASRLIVPLIGFDEVIGVLAVGRDDPDAYDEQGLQLLVIVAAKVASYLTALRARRRELAHEVVARGHAENERRRLQVLLAMLSHELRNPLAPIRGAVDILRAGTGDTSLHQQAVSVIDQQVQTLTRLVEDLLDASRVTTRKVLLQRTDVELNALVRQAADATRPQFASRRQELSVSFAASDLWVHGDRTRLKQVMLNLLTNAMKYTPERGHVWVSVAGDAREAVITVRDDGIGMRADLIPHLFELFTQGQEALDNTQHGLGIGLALVKSLVEMHGGAVKAASDGLGTGSEFVVRLPLLLAREEQPSPQSREDPPARSPEGDGARKPAGLRVLVVDDNHAAAAMLSMLLRHFGHDVRIASDGPSGLETAQTYRPDVAILDIGLPGMNGFEMAQHIRRDETLRVITLIAMSGYGGDEDKQRAQEVGFNHYLVKPADLDELERILTSVAAPRAS